MFCAQKTFFKILCVCRCCTHLFCTTSFNIILSYRFFETLHFTKYRIRRVSFSNKRNASHLVYGEAFAAFLAAASVHKVGGTRSYNYFPTETAYFRQNSDSQVQNFRQNAQCLNFAFKRLKKVSFSLELCVCGRNFSDKKIFDNFPKISLKFMGQLL